MNIFFHGNWQFNHQLAPPLLHVLSLKDCPRNLTKYEGKQSSKLPIFQLISELGEIRKNRLS